MSRSCCIWLMLLLLLSGKPLAGEKSLEHTRHLSISEGLAHSGVTCLLEDSKGYIWVGTYDGLNRYDGYDFRVFKNTVDLDLLASNRIRTLHEDMKGNLWIGTDEGISLYEYATGRFRNIYSHRRNGRGSTGPIVRKILELQDRNQILCATEDAGVLVMNGDYNYSGQYLHEDASENPVLFFSGAVIDNSNVLFASSTGLMHLDPGSGSFTRVLDRELGYCNSITQVDDSTLLITLEQGISFVNFNTSGRGSSFGLRSRHLDSYRFNSASVDELGNLWLGTLREGIVHIDNIKSIRNSGEFEKILFNVNTGFLRVSCISSSTTYGCWVGTFNMGIYRFDVRENPFRYYNAGMNKEYGLRTNHIVGFTPVDESRAYVTASGGGFALFDTQSGSFEPVPFVPPGNQPVGAGTIFTDSRGNIWFHIGEGGGLYRVLKGETGFSAMNPPKLPPSARRAIRAMAEDRHGNIWLGCGSGLYRMSLDENGEIVDVEDLNLLPIFKNNSLSLIRAVYVDPLYDFIWVGTEKEGLIRIDISGKGPVTGSWISQYKKNDEGRGTISSDFVSNIIRLPNEEMWIGTEGGGICRIIDSESSPSFVPYTEKNGLSNNVVKSIIFDEEYNLWISTNIGLNKFNTRDYTFRVFSKEDGLYFEDFWYASVKLGNGTILFSGQEGFIYFNPAGISDRESPPGLEFGELRILNRPILPGDTVGSRVLLDKILAYEDEISLKYNEDVFSVELTSLHFSNPDNHYIRYRLLPVNQEWIQVPSSQKFVHFNGLRPGEYSLHVMASSSMLEWSEPEILGITIAPPFWRTPIAYVVYFILLALIVYVVIYYTLRIKTLNYRLQIDQLEIDKVKEVNAAKLRFFSNISHEIKTPLTLLSGPVNVLAERYRGNPDVNDKLQIVQRQSKKIYRLVDQVHDFQRAEANRLKMNSTRFSFDNFIQEVLEDFSYLAENEGKKLEARGEESAVFVLADRDKLEKIFNNLLSNAFKYTAAGDSIRIDYKREDRDLVLSVSDSGQGISSEDMPHIFERFYQASKKDGKHSGGSGIGLAFTKRLVEMHYGYISAESEPGEGTTIHMRLPVIKSRINDEQQSVEMEIIAAEKECAPEEQYNKPFDLKGLKVSEDLKDSTVFIAEDNTDMRVYVSDILSKFFTVKAFKNGLECLSAMEQEWPDIVISDVVMPGLNGFELCKRIKSDIKTSHVPIILLTACTTTDDQIKGIIDGADMYIFKPFDVHHLVTSTESLLRNRQVLRERFQMNLPLSHHKSKLNNNDMAFLDKLYTLMEDNLDNHDLKLDRFARELYLNRSHFYQKVKALTNQTPFELLKNIRLEKAARLLAHEHLSVNEAYIRTGFKSRTNFNKLFKEKYNLTPGKYAAESLKQVG